MRMTTMEDRRWEKEAMRHGGGEIRVSWPELQFRLLHCDECLCHYDHPKAGCECECHGEEDDENDDV